jgi:5S rRNA maturation endonuclease (ribonuclease M5)
MISDAERLEKLEKAVEEMIERSESEPVIVEGKRDVRALREIGVGGIVKPVNTGIGIINFCEALSAEHDSFIILTDWDRKGGQIAHHLEIGFESVDVKYDTQIRATFAMLTKKEIKDVESLPSYLDRLRMSVLTKTPNDRRNRERRGKD